MITIFQKENNNNEFDDIHYTTSKLTITKQQRADEINEDDLNNFLREMAHIYSGSNILAKLKFHIVFPAVFKNKRIR